MAEVVRRYEQRRTFAKKLDSDKKFKPQPTLFCGDIKICRNLNVKKKNIKDGLCTVQGVIINWENEKWKWKRQEQEGSCSALLSIKKIKSESEKDKNRKACADHCY